MAAYIVAALALLLALEKCCKVKLTFISRIPVVVASGKLDKAALPPFDQQTDDAIINEGKPTTTTEVALAKIWNKVLQLRDADITESFFDLGG